MRVIDVKPLAPLSPPQPTMEEKLQAELDAVKLNFRELSYYAASRMNCVGFSLEVSEFQELNGDLIRRQLKVMHKHAKLLKKRLKLLKTHS